MRHFDEAAFKRRWRALCQAHETDPVEGATSYRVALTNARWLRRPPGPWWRNADLWAEWEGYDGGWDRPVEDEVFESLWQETRRSSTAKTLLEVSEEFGEEFLLKMIHEVWRELEEQGEIPLQKIHRRREARHRRQSQRRRGLHSR
jgi:hypothetical protein